MRLPSATVYAVRALAYLAPHEGGPVPSHVIARVGGMSGSFLLNALNALAESRLVRSQRGARGSYRLARPAKRITLLEVVEAVDGPVRGEVSPAGTGAAAAFDERLLAARERAAEAARAQLRRVSLADLAGA